MTFRLRALRAVVLLAGFHLMGVGLLAAMAVLDWLLVTRLLTEQAAWFEGTVLAVTALLAVTIVRGMVTSLRAGRLGPAPAAVAITPQEQPRLWEEVRAAARAAGERAPDELFLVAEVNAGVAEHGRLLGLLPGRRRMSLGLPLLTGLTVPQLRAVLAHEFGHFAHGDTRLGGLTMRGRAALVHTVRAFETGDTWLHHPVGRLYTAYARMFLQASHSTARRQELVADQVAARHAGREATAAALRATQVLEAAHRRYLATYATLGEPLAALPPVGEVGGGFRHLLAARSTQQLARLAAESRPSRPHPYDSHPPTPERIALIEALPPGDDNQQNRPDGPDGPEALSLLREPDRLFAALEARTLPPEASTMRRMSWDDLVLARAVADADDWSRPLRLAVARTLRSSEPDGELPGLEEILDAFDRGLLWPEIADRMPKPPQAARLTGQSARNFLRPRIFDALAGLVHLRLVALGQATADIAWAGQPGLALPEAWEKGMDDALDAATADTPDTTPLRTLLTSHTPTPPP
ncbi:M48 family metalloprotease [Kitasatospora sp. NA04385]|uniref:M48 family metallopeptidase n=1 Tax=Kitasatospora sp. NA04385 TaxID=2742135 RepID=UPI00158FEEF2|nr:M48 family metallopeptidase [Kitasatospora sp. NA04385]QKW17679.1 M48 family metalloprotease [Kitasatospora sp. NA04385]